MNKSDLLGKCGKATATGDNVVDIEDLLRPFELPDSVMYIFCKGCGMVFEIPEDVADNMAGKAIDKSDLYIETQGCPQCDGANLYRIRRISELLQ